MSQKTLKKTELGEKKTFFNKNKKGRQREAKSKYSTYTIKSIEDLSKSASWV